MVLHMGELPLKSNRLLHFNVTFMHHIGFKKELVVSGTCSIVITVFLLMVIVKGGALLWQL